MLRRLKHFLYFPVAHYFAFFAAIRLRRWHPRVVVITGSNGKTTALNVVEARLGGIARYSHGANSSFGIPFDILGLKRGEEYSLSDWLIFGLRAPFMTLKRVPTEKIYVVEADCDRPVEGDFLSAILHPEVVIWLSCARTHTMNFEKVVRSGVFPTVDAAIAHEFGYFIERASRLVIVNGDNSLIETELLRTRAEVVKVYQHELQEHVVRTSGTHFKVSDRSYDYSYLMPRETSYAIAAAERLAVYFNIAAPDDLSMFSMPPGRSSVFRGVSGTTIIDSSYNANASSIEVFVRAVQEIQGVRWLILGDMTEQGSQEKEEHEKVARLVANAGFERVILVGPRLKRYAHPLIPQSICFEQPRDALDYLRSHVRGNEVLAFKGARFLEGIIEHLLADKADAAKLCRREKVWQTRRKRWRL